MRLLQLCEKIATDFVGRGEADLNRRLDDRCINYLGLLCADAIRGQKRNDLRVLFLISVEFAKVWCQPQLDG